MCRKNPKTENRLDLVAGVTAACVLICLAIVLFWCFHIMYQTGKIDPTNPDITGQIIMNGWMNKSQTR